MNNESRIGMINALIEAAEYTINHPKADRGTMLMIKEDTYDKIKLVMDGKNPWKEEK